MLAKLNLYYVHDPMCSWCWAFRPVWQSVLEKLPKNIQVHTILGGLAADSDKPMPKDMQQFLMQTWQRIIKEVPETSFNFEFWDVCSPRRSTYPACRAIISAKNQSAEFETKMIHAIQLAYYQHARNPSDISTLCELASEVGLDDALFATDLNSEDTQVELLKQMQFARKIGGNSFPSLFLQRDAGYQAIKLSYTDANAMLKQI